MFAHAISSTKPADACQSTTIGPSPWSRMPETSVMTFAP